MEVGSDGLLRNEEIEIEEEVISDEIEEAVISDEIPEIEGKSFCYDFKARSLIGKKSKSS